MIDLKAIQNEESPVFTKLGKEDNGDLSAEILTEKVEICSSVDNKDNEIIINNSNEIVNEIVTEEKINDTDVVEEEEVGEINDEVVHEDNNNNKKKKNKNKKKK
jgi:hypothetical protein